MDENVYVRNGYKDREDYLHSLADNFGVSYKVVLMLARFLGPNEDFDGLVTELDDYSELMENE